MAQKQALVIGLGQFGSALARSLVAQHVEVVGIDTRMERVQAAAPYLTDVVCLNATDEAALAGLAPSRRDLCAVSLGENAREGSILVTALLRQMGAPKIISRATDDLHERVLRWSAPTRS
ncbi:MAG: NAD-binding protein [Deltaproteobacteria bacterium]|nr:NAD-binding protein [Deltaproteobacteria bacterium]